MEFIKVGKNYMIKNGNGRMITEKEKLELENKELIIKDIQSNECQGKTTQKLTRNKKRLKSIEKDVDLQFIDSKRVVEYIRKQTALDNEVQYDPIKETNSAI